MARVFMSGAELDAAATTAFPSGSTLPDGFKSGSGVLTRDVSVFRSGAASFKFDSGAGNATITVEFTPAAVVVGSYVRAFYRVASAPTAAATIMTVDSGASTPLVRLRTDGALELVVVGAAQGSPSAGITDATWHRVELRTDRVSTNFTYAELRVDGAVVATWSGTQAIVSSKWLIGWITAPGASKVINVDDIAINDTTGAVQNSWPGDGKVLLLVPTADSAVGTGWTNDQAQTTGLFNSVKSTPPAGIADTTTGGGGHQIRNATSNANSNYDATLTTYSAAGVGASDVINAVQPVCATSAPAATSAKLGTVGVVSNPAITNVNLDSTGTSGAFWGGTVAGAYATGWKWSLGTMTQVPSVTKGTAPVMRITQVTASTRIAMVCFMGIYVDYTLAAAAPATKPRRYGQSYTVAHRRAALR